MKDPQNQPKILRASKSEVMSRMELYRLVAVVRSKNAEDAFTLARAVADAGIWFVEITLTVPGALEVIKDLASRRDIYVGAGTVLSKREARQAIVSGASFIVSPTLELDLIPICAKSEVTCIPGAATPTEVLTAARKGADLVKIFPADLAGGPDFVRQMAGPFPNVRFMVSGGVSKENIQDYVRAGVIGICLGSAYLGNLLAQRGLEGFIKEVKHFVTLIENTPTP